MPYVGQVLQEKAIVMAGATVGGLIGGAMAGKMGGIGGGALGGALGKAVGAATSHQDYFTADWFADHFEAMYVGFLVAPSG